MNNTKIDIHDFNFREQDNHSLVVLLKELQETLDNLQLRYNVFPRELMDFEIELCAELDYRADIQNMKKTVLELKRKNDKRLQEKE